jgi:hypothetical protein
VFLVACPDIFADDHLSAMDLVQFNPVIQPNLVANGFDFQVEDLKYSLDASGAVQCR